MTKFNAKKVLIVFFSSIVIWFALDRIVKIFFDSGTFSVGQKISDSILGIFHLTLIHNTGAAFGMFSNSTLVLAIISLVLTAVLIVFFFVCFQKSKDNKSDIKINCWHAFFVGLICAGGLGNAIDRLISGYVIDYICLDFINFPVFNIADIGVTCGVFLLVVYVIISQFRIKN